jgi:hypothetical protein
MEAHARLIKHDHPDAVTVYIGPCIAKKREADHSSFVDLSLTFEDLTRWLVAEGVMLTPEPDGLSESRARLFPPRAASAHHEAQPCDHLSQRGRDAKLHRGHQGPRFRRAFKLFYRDVRLRGQLHRRAGHGAPALPVRDYAIVNAYAGRNDFAVAQPMPDELAEPHAPSPSMPRTSARRRSKRRSARWAK